MPRYEKGTPEYYADRERQNRNKRRSRARQREIKAGLKIQNELNNNKYSPQVRERKMAEMNRRFNNAQELRIRDEYGRQIKGRTVASVDARYQEILQENAQRDIDSVYESRGKPARTDYLNAKTMILADLQLGKKLHHGTQQDIDTFWAVTKGIWEGTEDVGERLDKIMDYYGNYDFDEVYNEVVSQAKDIARTKSLYYKVDKSDFTEEQREAYELLQRQDDSDATRDYKLIVASSITYADIVIEPTEA